MGDAGREIARVAREIEANLVVVGHPNSEIDQLLPWAYRRQVLKAVASGESHTEISCAGERFGFYGKL
jgi:hypothetical protein